MTPLPSSRPWSSTALPVVILCGLTLSFHYPLWFPGLVLIMRDAFRFFLPIKQYAIERLSAGELPQWFPYEGLGRPFIGIPVTGVFHPFTFLYGVLPIHDAYRVSALLSCLAAALGAFALGRLLQYSRGAALMAGAGFACSGYIVSVTENVVYLYSTCLLPIFCAALEQALVRGRAWIVTSSLVWASVFLNGDVQTGYYYGLIAFLWAASRAPTFSRGSILRLVVISLLAALLAGVQLGPAAGVFAGSIRTQPTLFHEQALDWSTHPLRLFTVVASPVGEVINEDQIGRIFFGNRAPREAVGGYWAESLYLGVPIVGLALLGAWTRRDLRGLALLGCLALLLSLGRFGGLYEVFYHAVPLWSAFRYPERLMGVVSFCAAMLAGAGVDALYARRGGPWPWIVTACVCGAIGLGLRSEAAHLLAAGHFGAPPALAREMTDSAGLALLFSSAAAMGTGIIVLAMQRTLLRRELLFALLIGIVILDLARANQPAYHMGPVEAATFKPGLVDAIVRHAGGSGPGSFRIISYLDTQMAFPKSLTQWLDPIGLSTLMLRETLDVEHNAQFHIESVRGYLPGYSPAYAALLKHTLGPEFIARFNGVYFIGRREHFYSPRFAESFVAVLPDYDLALVKNPVLAKPRAYLSRRPEATTAPVDMAALLTRPDFLSGEVDLIEAWGEELPRPAQGGAAEIQRYAPETVQVRVDSPNPAVLVLLDTFDAGWRAGLENGQELRILRANGLVRAVVVPAGAHLVSFVYQTPLLKEGTIASLAGVLVCAGMLVRRRWSRKKTVTSCF